MKRRALSILIPVPLLLGAALAACSEARPVEPNDAAADFAARINGGETPAAQPTEQPGSPPLAAPQLVPPRPVGDPQALPLAGAPAGSGSISPNCNADRMGPFLGRTADDATRLAVMSAAQGASDVRFVPAGAAFIESDPANPRLNLMLDSQGVIRDAKCG